MSRPERKFDPAKAEKLDSPERQRLIPGGNVVDSLDLTGSEIVVDYGAGSGVLTASLVESLPEGEVHAVDESAEMLEKLRERLGDEHPPNLRLHLIEENRAELPDGAADRILAVNLLHEVVGEGALAEMRRLLKPDGFLLIIDWRADVERDEGPPAHVSLTPEGGREMLEEAGFSVEDVGDEFPVHFAFAVRVG